VRRGTTLIELIVTLAVMGLLAGLAATSVAGLHRVKKDVRAETLAESRRKAIRSGRPVGVGGLEPVLFLPDGRAVGRGVDPLTGVILDAGR
jgi:prepilin-type N-terminal cleavage/methylation domain-containing protein